MRDLLRAHWLFLLVLGLGTALRLLVQLTYEPAIFFFDSFTYLKHAVHPAPDTPRPVGYSVLVLRPLLVFHDLAVIPLVQHLCGLAMGTVIYVVLLRRGVRHWLAAVAATPVLLDGYMLQIEQNIASDTVFLTLVTGALALLLWKVRPSPGVAAAAGLLLGLAATVRFVGAPLIAVALLYVLVVSVGMRRLVNIALLAVTAAMPLLVYSTWSYQHTGEFRPGGGTMSARTLYARTAPLADCGLLAEGGAPLYVQRICPQAPPQQRSENPKPYMLQTIPQRWSVPGLPAGVSRYEALQDFGMRVVRNQPGRVMVAVLDDFKNGFAWARFQPPDAWRLEVWRFPLTPTATGKGAFGLPGQEAFDASATTRHFGGPGVSVDRGAARLLRGYQSTVYARGPVFALGILVAVLAALGLGGARRSRLGAPALLVAGTALALLLSAAAYSFSWRYQLPSIPLLPWAAALGLAALLPRLRRQDTTPEHPTHAEPDETDGHGGYGTDEIAVAGFRAGYGRVHLAPVVVVIAAYNETDAIGDALDAIPRDVLGLTVDIVVVDDGSDDGTAAVAAAHGVYVCRCESNRGQGAALRLGYKLAREGHASYIATTDADGQYDADELPMLLLPLVDDEADFVSGSRRLGRAETTDRLRSLGVRMFGFVISVLTGTRITDPANGFRAMRAGLTGVVTLRQPQYQAAELLIGALAHGFRVTERATTMRERTAGQTKKGGNLLYGYRYARVVAGTWLRERRSRTAAPVGVRSRTETSGAGR